MAILPVEQISTDIGVAIDNAGTKPRRGGRKPGSKNKPKPGCIPPGERLSVELEQLAQKVADMRQVVANCCTLLQQAMSMRIGCMDSESRVADITKQRAQLEQEAHERLRAML